MFYTPHNDDYQGDIVIAYIKYKLAAQPSMGNCHRLPKPLSKQQLDGWGYHGNQPLQQYRNSYKRCLRLVRLSTLGMSQHGTTVQIV
jgi:hypothetical protein